MKNGTLVLISLVALTVAGFARNGSSAVSADDEKAVASAVSDFYVALNTMFTGDLDQMKEVWSHADDVTYMGPAGGFQVGGSQVREIWEEQAALKLGGRVEPTDMRIAMGRDIAVAHNIETGENVDAKGETQKVSIRATNIFRKEDGEWKMIGHHTDLLSFLTK